MHTYSRARLTTGKWVSPLMFWGGGLALAAVLAASILHFGDVQFGGYDGSIVINHAWQLHLGYQPYVDVVTGVPPVFLIGSGLAFDLWGVRWHALVLVAAFFSAATFLLQVALLRRLNFGTGWSLLLPFAIQSMTMVPVAWWWYNQVTAVLNCLFLSAALLLYQRPQSMFSQTALIVSTTLLSLAKPNVAGPLLILVFGVLITIRHMRRSVIVLFGCAGVLALVMLVLSRINPLDVVASYRYFVGDALSIRRMARFLLLNDSYEVVQTFALIIPSVLAMVLVLLRVQVSPSNKDYTSSITVMLPPIKKAEVPYLAIGLIGIGVGVWGMMTNNEYNMSDAAVILLGIAAVVLLLRSRLTRPWRQTLVLTLIIASTVLLATNGLRYTMLRWRVYGVGPGAFFENAPLTTLESPPCSEAYRLVPALFGS